MRTIITMLLIAVSLTVAQTAPAIIPVRVWPNVVYWNGHQFIHASATICVKAGYRMIPAKPVTPEGKRIVSEQFIQDPDDVSMCKYEIVYEDIPPPPVVPPVEPEVLTNIAVKDCVFSFTTNGQYRGIIWTNAPKTNAVPTEE